MPILNYTTTIDAHRTVTEVQRLLATHGARAIMVEYNSAGAPVGLAFEIVRGDRTLRYRLPCRHENLLVLLRKDPSVKAAHKTPAHALRVGWRILLNWCEVQMALIDADLSSVDEVFMPYALVGDNQTIYERWSSTLLLPGGNNG